MATNTRFYVEGLTEFRSALRAVDKALPKELQKVNKAAAIEVADEAKDAYTHFFTPRTGGHQAAIRALATQAKAQVRLREGPKSGGLFGQEFGSNRYMQFYPWAGELVIGQSGGAGKFFYPTLREKVPEIRDRYLAMLDLFNARLARGR